MLRIAFVAADRTHASRSVTHSHDTQGLGLAADASRYLRTPVAVLVRVTVATSPPPALGSLRGWASIPTFAALQDVLLPPGGGQFGTIAPLRGMRVPGWEDASRNTATIAVSREHRAGQVRSEQPMRTGTRAHGRGREKASRLRDRGRARRVSLWGGPIVTKKDNAGRQ